jgi:hypothetical protein
MTKDHSTKPKVIKPFGVDVQLVRDAIMQSFIIPGEIEEGEGHARQPGSTKKKFRPALRKTRRKMAERSRRINRRNGSARR